MSERPLTTSPPVTLARADCSVGEVVLRCRDDVIELIVDGVFVMDTAEVSTETELATLPLARHARPRRVLVGGLGLGFTASTVLEDERVEEVVVAEIADPLIDWARAGALPAHGLGDPRLTLLRADVAETLRASPREWDLVLLDVDNGPGFLVRRENAWLYAAAGLGVAVRALAPGGILAIWSSHRAPALREALDSIETASVAEVVRVVQREGRDLEYVIYLVTRAGAQQTDLSAPHTGE